jgi:putative endonuclease
MAQHNLTGNTGEALAAVYLTGNGYNILHQNWRHSRWEVDIIAEKETILHFVEVKTRKTGTFGYPEESVDKKKMQNLINAAEEYLYRYPQWKRVQFDILSIIIIKEKPVEYFLIEDVYL